MKKFQFNLQSVLDFREEQEQAARRACAAAAADMERAVQALRVANENLDSHFRAVKDRSQAVSRIAELQALRQYSIVLEERARLCNRDLQRTAFSFKQASEKLAHASKQRQMIGKLREKRYQVYDFELARIDQKQMDEFASEAARRSTGTVTPNQPFHP